MEFRYRDGERRASSFTSSSNPRPRLSLEELQRELEEERLKEAIMESRIVQRRMIEEESLHDDEMRRMRHHPPPLPRLPPYILEPQPQPPMVALPPRQRDLHRDRIAVYLEPVQTVRRESFPDEDEDEDENSVSGGAVRDGGGSSRSNRSGVEKEANIDHNNKKNKNKKKKKTKKKKKKRALSAGKEIEKKKSGLWCRTCNVSCSGKVAMDSHLSGKRHALALKRKSQDAEEERAQVVID